MPEGLALALCIVARFGVISVVGWFAEPVNIVLLGSFFGRACDGVNALAADGAARPDPAEATPGTARQAPARDALPDR